MKVPIRARKRQLGIGTARHLEFVDGQTFPPFVVRSVNPLLAKDPGRPSGIVKLSNRHGYRKGSEAFQFPALALK
jgi:hypothetical protein